MRKIQIKREMIQMGDDLVICIQNENGHIGSVVTGEPYVKNGKLHVTCNTFNRLSHKDDVIAMMYAKAAVIKYRCVVTCVCGIHLDDIDASEMQAIMSWCQDDIQKL